MPTRQGPSTPPRAHPRQCRRPCRSFPMFHVERAAAFPRGAPWPPSRPFRLHQAFAAFSSLLFLKGAVHFIHAGSSCFFRSSGQGLPCQSFQYTTVCEKKNHNLVTILQDYPASFARFGMRMVKRMPSSVSSRCMSACTPARCISPSEWRMVFKKMRTSLTI